MIQANFKRSSLVNRFHPKLFGPDMKTFRMVILLLAIFLVSLPNLACGASSLIGSGQTVDEYTLNDVTVLSDGTIMIVGKENLDAFRFTFLPGSTDPITDYMGALGGTAPQGSANAISRDGVYVVGESTTDNFYTSGYIWTETIPLLELGPPPSETNSGVWASGVSDDGSVIVGRGTPISGRNWGALRWDVDWSDPNNPSVSSITPLGVLTGASATGVSYATDVSGNGDIIVGYSSYTSAYTQYQAFRWVADTPGSTSGSMQGLGFLQDDDTSTAVAVSQDGRFTVGTSHSRSSDYQAVRWDANDSSILGLGFPSGYESSIATDVSDDGNIVVGRAQSPIDQNDPYSRAIYWTPTDKMQTLESVLTSQGVDVSNWILTEASAISGDGKAIVGYGQVGGEYDVFLAFLDPQSTTTTTTTSTTTTTTSTTTTQPATSTTTTTTQPATSTTTTTLPSTDPGIIGVTDFTNSLGDIHKGRALGHKINTLMGRVVSNFASSGPGAIADYLHGKSIISPVFAYEEGSEAIMAGVAAEHSYDTVTVKVALAGVDAEDDGRYNGNVELSGYSLGIAVDMYPGKMAKSSAMEPLNITIGYDHGFYEGDFDRSYLNGATPEISNGEPDVDTMSAYIEAGWRFALSEKASIRPYVELYYQKTEMDSYTETGGTFPGTVSSQDESSTKYSLGLEGENQVSDRFKVGIDVVGIKLSDDQGPGLAVSVPNLGVFVYPGVKYDDTWAEFALNSQWNFTDDLWISGEIRGTTGSDYPEDWSARVELSYAF